MSCESPLTTFLNHPPLCSMTRLLALTRGFGDDARRLFHDSIGSISNISKIHLSNQRKLFGNILEFLEDGCCPETSIRIGDDILKISTWSDWKLSCLSVLNPCIVMDCKNLFGGYDMIGSLLRRLCVKDGAADYYMLC